MHEIIMIGGEKVMVEFIKILESKDPGYQFGLYRLPGGGHVIGYREHGNVELYQDPYRSPNSADLRESNEVDQQNG